MFRCGTALFGETAQVLFDFRMIVSMFRARVQDPVDEAGAPARQSSKKSFRGEGVDEFRTQS